MSKTVMIITGESSGELYGALLAKEILSFWPDAHVCGVGGERMKRAGVDVFAGIAGAFGLAEAISSYSAVKDTFRKTLQKMSEVSPEIIILIDYPDFNFRVAKEARKHGIKVLYYVSPQVWAWRKGRLRDMAGFVDRMAVLLPFEEEMYRRAGIPCEFVGHPILDDMSSIPSDKRVAKENLGIDQEKPCLALLPGSRRSELKRHLAVMLALVKKFREEYPDYQLFMPIAPNIDIADYESYFERFEKEGVQARREDAVLVLSAAEAAVIASGTATLQAAFRETPMVVIYKLFPLTYIIGRLLIRVKHITLANLILDKEVVTELIQGNATPDNVLRELRLILPEGERRERMIQDLRKIKSFFADRQPSRRVAEMTGELAGWA